MLAAADLASKVWAWLLAGSPPHWVSALIVTTMVLSSVVNALTKHYKDAQSPWAKRLLVVIDVLSFLASFGSPQTLKLPFKTSADPGEKKQDDDKDPPTFPPGGGLALVATVLLLVGCAIGLSGCAPGITAGYQTIANAATVHKQGMELFDKFDKAQQEKILKAAKDRRDPDGGEGALKSYHAQQAKVIAVFDKAAGTILAAEASMPLIKLGVEKQKTPGVWIATLLGQISAMIGALTELGVPGLDALAAPPKTSWRMSPSVRMATDLRPSDLDIGETCYFALTDGRETHRYPCRNGPPRAVYNVTSDGQSGGLVTSAVQ